MLSMTFDAADTLQTCINNQFNSPILNPQKTPKKDKFDSQKRIQSSVIILLSDSVMCPKQLPIEVCP